jgi:uncharacterized protein YciI
MRHFVLFYDYVPDFVTLRAPYRAEHLQLARASVARDELQLGGALVDEPLGLLLFKTATADPVREFVAKDPYVLHGLVRSYRIREWTTVVGADAACPVP